MGSDFDAMVHDPLEKSSVVFDVSCRVVLDDRMNRILEDPGYVDVFTKLVHHRHLMLFVTQQVLFPR